MDEESSGTSTVLSVSHDLGVAGIVVGWYLVGGLEF